MLEDIGLYDTLMGSDQYDFVRKHTMKRSGARFGLWVLAAIQGSAEPGWSRDAGSAGIDLPLGETAAWGQDCCQDCCQRSRWGGPPPPEASRIRVQN